jgi:putative transcriptional regulator
MPIVVNLDVVMAQRKVSLNELSEMVDITLSNLSILKTGKAKAIRFSTLEALCKALDCQPGEILEHTGKEPHLSVFIFNAKTLHRSTLTRRSGSCCASIAMLG